jgi:large subunit ribosomal protein L22
MVAKARMRYLGSSAQKTRLVVDQIRGMGVNEAIATLRESPKAVARDIVKVLRSAVANAENGEQRVDADTLFISRAAVDGGPSLKRIRPATFGRAFRVLRRTCHITLELDGREDPRPRLSRAKRRAAGGKATAGSGAEGKPGAERKRSAEGKTRAEGRTRKKGAKPGGAAGSEGPTAGEAGGDE